MTPHPERVADQPGPWQRIRKPVDFPILILLAVSVLAVLWTNHLYQRKTIPFPRQASEFRPAPHLDQEIRALRAILEKDPENTAAWVDLAVAYFEQGPEQYLQALEALERARDLGALDHRLFYYSAVMYEAKGLPDYATPEYERFLRHHPEDTETRLRLGNLYYHLDEMEKSIEQYKRVLALRPGDPLVAFNLALAYRDQSRWNEGLDLMKAVLEKGRSLPAGGYKLLGDLYRGLGDFPQALSHYHTELVRSKDDPELAVAMAQAYEGQNDFAQAAAQWARVLELDPENRGAKNKMRLLKRKQKSAKR